ncbi:hypothetical protein J6590_074108 [Homalodisca vitripennis]|nr:hypothetical protein J6590_074108 [Homalodisca vitripennis]
MEESKIWRYLMVLIGAFNLTVLLCAVTWHYIDHTSISVSEPSSLTNSMLTVPIPLVHGPRVEPSLQFVVIFSRHGTRSPYGDFPAVPYPAKNKTIWPHGRLQLTQEYATPRVAQHTQLMMYTNFKYLAHFILEMSHGQIDRQKKKCLHPPSDKHKFVSILSFNDVPRVINYANAQPIDFHPTSSI